MVKVGDVADLVWTAFSMVLGCVGMVECVGCVDV